MKIVSVSGKSLYNSEKKLVKDAVSDALESGANIRGANLRGAYFSGADLRDADLRGAYLRDAYLRGANLSGADFSGADFSGADLRGANISGAYLRGADFSGAYLRDADLRDADLSGADLSGADLSGADFSGADLRDADLSGADLRVAKNIPYIPLSCPSKGSFTAWKKIRGKLIELEIPADASRSSATTNKCRCDKAKVISITDIATNEQISKVINYKFGSTLYKVGEMVYPDAFDEDRYKECSNGIHFFIDKQLAIDY